MLLESNLLKAPSFNSTNFHPPAPSPKWKKFLTPKSILVTWKPFERKSSTSAALNGSQNHHHQLLSHTSHGYLRLKPQVVVYDYTS